MSLFTLNQRISGLQQQINNLGPSVLQNIDEVLQIGNISETNIIFNDSSINLHTNTDDITITAVNVSNGTITTTWNDILINSSGTVPELSQVLTAGNSGTIGQTIVLGDTTYADTSISSNADFSVQSSGGDVLTLGCAGTSLNVWRSGIQPDGYLYDFPTASIHMGTNSLKIGDANYKPTGILYTGSATTIENTNDTMTINGDDALSLSSTNGNINITTPNGVINSDAIIMNSVGFNANYNAGGITYISNDPTTINTTIGDLYITAHEHLFLTSQTDSLIFNSGANININTGDSLYITATLGIDIDKTTSSLIYHNTNGVATDKITIDNTGIIKTETATSNTTINAGSESIQQSVSGYTTTPILELNNVFTTAGNTTGVPSIKFNKSGRNAIAGDVIGSQHFYGKNYAGTSTEFTNIEASVRNTGVGNDDGSIAFSCLINGTMTEFFRINGADSENNMFLPLDMNGQSIKSSSGNLNLSASGSSGTGAISLTTKNGTAGSGAGLLLTGNTLLSGSSGGSSGQHLCLTIGGVVYKINLLNA